MTSSALSTRKNQYWKTHRAANSLIENTAPIITITKATLKDKAPYFACEFCSDHEMEILCDEVMMRRLTPDPIVFYF